MVEKHGQTVFHEAIYYDEMHLSKNSKTGAWTIIGWRPTLLDETPHENDGVHLSLVLAGSPELGIIHYIVTTESVTGAKVLELFKELVTKYVTDFSPAQRSKRRAVIMDNVGTHHSACLVNYLQGELISPSLCLEYLPPYSPFLNPLEELFVYIKQQIWLQRAADTSTDEDRYQQIKRCVQIVTDAKKKNMLFPFFLHVQEFLRSCKTREPVYTQQLYESSHIGDEVDQCPILSESIETLLNSYLPHSYEEFTAEQCALVLAQYGVPRLTDSYVEDVIMAEP
ncbi:hypothetical protein PINS_up020292 [Pythium insidiosum]|nr:hypothetical protein PINS_up020292 [Pythium insidiosum]